MLLEKNCLQEALELAQSRQLNSDLVYKKIIQQQCSSWNECSKQDWMNSPCYDCSTLFDILKHSSLSLLLYSMEYYSIPSRLTMDALFSFGYSHFLSNQSSLNEKEQQQFLLLHLKWKVFLQGQFMLDKVNCQIWQVKSSISLLFIEISTYVITSNRKPVS